MGLDVYVGSLTRYLTGDWETVVQRWARETGAKLQVVRQHDPADAIRDPATILPAVVSWRAGLSRSLQQAGGPLLEWDERADAPYFTDKPAWDAYGDLVLWAAYSEQPEHIPPAESVDRWFEDPVFRSVREGPNRYPTLIHGAEVWLPVDFTFTFQAPWITGDDLTFGSTHQLIRELRLLASGTWDDTDANLVAWRASGKEKGASMPQGARFAFSVFLTLATKSFENRLVMKLDY